LCSVRSPYPRWKVLLVLFFGSSLFFLILPLLIFFVSVFLDGLFGFPRFYWFPVNFVAGFVIGGFGWFLSFWSVYAQYRYGGGTPAAFLPPVRLVTEGPYRFSRNPMALGNMIFYVGIGVFLGSVSYILVTVIGFTVLFVYNKVFEERELIARFGDEYIEYMKRTPFLFSFRRRKRRK